MSNTRPQDRLTTSDSEGRRIYLYPSDVKGKYRRLRVNVHAVLIFVFLVLPWVKIGGAPLLLLDVPHRRFSLFGYMFWAHETPLLVFLVIGGALTLGLVTAIFGRIWCGWACPQTVFIDGVFRRIERIIEGDGFTRKRLDQEPWTGMWLLKKSVKWMIFTLVSLVIGHSFLAYFVGTDALAQMIQSSPLKNPGSFILMAGVTAAVLFDFGWFREQFCTVLCPYGRFQSILMDERSLVIAYDEKRGEPRRRVENKTLNTGDCVNCSRCVQVCPTGIDIRNGLQMECIACTACIDACDEVMTRVKKPKGLIRYTSQASPDSEKNSVLRPRVILYSLFLGLVIVGLVVTLVVRDIVQVQIVRSHDAPYQEIILSTSLPEILNRFKIDVKNVGSNQVKVSLEPEDVDVKILVANGPLVISPGAKVSSDVFIHFPKSKLNLGHFKAKIKILIFEDGKNTSSRIEEVPLVGPYR